MAHRFRPEHEPRHPVHVTLRAKRGVPSFRNERLYRILRGVFATAHGAEFRVAHYSVQADHIHMIVEANDKATLSSRIRSVVIRIALRLNAALSRRGALWGDRYHRHDLQSVREVRNALVYVVQNLKKHRGYPRDARIFDPYSSALWLEGWHADDRPKRIAAEAPPVARAKTWLLRVGWQRYGPFRAVEGPRSAAR